MNKCLTCGKEINDTFFCCSSKCYFLLDISERKTIKEIKEDIRYHWKVFCFPQENSAKARTGMVFSEERKKKISQNRKGIPVSEYQKECLKIANTGKKQSEETRKKHSISIKKRYKDPIWAEEQRQKHLTEACLKKRKENGIHNWQNPEYIKKQIESRHLTPNKSEIKFLDFLKSLCLNEWEYVGDFKVVIGGKSPDYINTKDKPLLIEFNGIYWHRDETAEDVKNRIAHFAKYGFKTLVIDDIEFNKNKDMVSEKIKDFVGV